MKLYKMAQINEYHVDPRNCVSKKFDDPASGGVGKRKHHYFIQFMKIEM